MENKDQKQRPCSNLPEMIRQPRDVVFGYSPFVVLHYCGGCSFFIFIFYLHFPHTDLGMWEMKSLPLFTRDSLSIVLNSMNDAFCYLLFAGVSIPFAVDDWANQCKRRSLLSFTRV